MRGMQDPRPVIAIFGSSRPQPGSAAWQQAYELGLALAQAGYQIANGGYGGTMAAAAQAACGVANALVIGVTCAAFGRSGPNPWIGKEISTSELNQRLKTLIELAHAYIVLPGGTGTLLELAMVWELINKHFLPERPIICLSRFWQPVVEVIEKSGEINAGLVHFCDEIDQILVLLKGKLANLERNTNE